MTTDQRKPTQKPRPKCNLPDCRETDDLTRGLCPVHWSTHRGLADQDPTVDVPEGVALP